MPDAPRTRIVLERADVPAAGGVLLASDVHRVDDDTVRPCLVQRVPYGRTVPAIANGALDIRRAVDAGFAVVVQDCRGRGDSTGTFTPFIDERADAEVTFDWIVAQPWCDGRIGTFGRSYAGINQWLAAAGGHPALRAICPTISGADPNAWIRPCEVLEWGFVLWWAVRYLAPAHSQGAELRAFLDDPESLFGADADVILAATEQALPFLQSWLCDGGPSAREQVICAVPAFVTAGWFDIFARSTLDTWSDLPVEPRSRLVIGPWAHGGAFSGIYPDWSAGPGASDAAIDLVGMQLRWFRSVFDESHEPDTAERQVSAHICNTGSWQRLDAWPPSDDSLLDMHAQFGRDGALQLRIGTAQPGDQPLRMQLVTDPGRPFPTCGGPTFLPGMEVARSAGPRSQLDLLARDDVVWIHAEPLDRDLVALGDLRAVVDVDHDGHAGVEQLVCVRLCDRGPGGVTLAVCEGAAKVPPAPGAHQVSVRLGPIGWTFERGHQLVLAVSRSSWPRWQPPSQDETRRMRLDAATLHVPLG